MLIVDLSNVNKKPDFHRFKQAGVNGVWFKVTEGKTFVDPATHEWAAEARDVGLRIGSYHFARPDNGNTAISEAINFCKHALKIGRRDLRPVLDYENRRKGGSDEAWIRGFNAHVKYELGVGPLFYSYPWLIKQLRLSKPVGYGLWLADYEPTIRIPSPWSKAAAWQYTSTGNVAGYTPIDKTKVLSKTAVLAHPVLGLV